MFFTLTYVAANGLCYNSWQLGDRVFFITEKLKQEIKTNNLPKTIHEVLAFVSGFVSYLIFIPYSLLSIKYCFNCG